MERRRGQIDVVLDKLLVKSIKGKGATVVKVALRMVGGGVIMCVCVRWE